MALRAGRVGVRPDQVDNQGRIIATGGGGGVKVNVYAIDFTPSNNASSTKSGGWQFTTHNDITIKGIRFFGRSTECSVYLSDTAGNPIVSKTGVTIEVNKWNDILFDNPVTLDANKTYVVWGSHPDIGMKYKSGGGTSPLVTYVKGVGNTTSNTFPTTDESNLMGVDLIIPISFT